MLTSQWGAGTEDDTGDNVLSSLINNEEEDDDDTANADDDENNVYENGQ